MLCKLYIKIINSYPCTVIKTKWKKKKKNESLSSWLDISNDTRLTVSFDHQLTFNRVSRDNSCTVYSFYSDDNDVLVVFIIDERKARVVYTTEGCSACILYQRWRKKRVMTRIGGSVYNKATKSNCIVAVVYYGLLLVSTFERTSCSERTSIPLISTSFQ